MIANKHQTAINTYIVQSRKLFHCNCRIKVPYYCGDELFEECFGLMEAINQRYNSFESGSYFDQINQYAGHWVEVDDITEQLLGWIKKVSMITEAAYDITSMPILRIWGFFEDNQDAVPSAEALQKTLQKVDYRNIEIEKGRVRIAKGQEITTGSFIKAYAVDQVINFLKEQGISDAVVNAGGSTITALNDDQHPNWYVDIPDATCENATNKIPLSNQSFSMSGKVNNHIIIRGKLYGHILNARTGMPVNTAQVAVISPSAFMGDVLSTALFSVEKETFEAVVTELQQNFKFEYYRIEDNGHKTQSDAFNTFF